MNNTLLRIICIAQQGLQEAWRTRLFLLVAMTGFICAGIGEFGGQLVLTGTVATKLTLYSFLTRLALVGILAVYVIQALSRDRIDKQLEMYLSLDMSREIYVLGRLLGMILAASLAAVICALYPLVYAGPIAAVAWLISLASELAIVIALAVFITISINNVAASFSIVAGFYLLARSMGNIILLSQSPLLQGGETGIEWIRTLLELVGLLLPDLWHFVQTEWLFGDTDSLLSVGSNLLVALVYCLLLLVATAIDLHRKNL